MRPTESMILADGFDHEQAVEYVADLGKLGSCPGLERIEKLCSLLNDPQDELSFIHIAGTNGKGSTAAMIASVLNESGAKVGMYYSPAMTGITDHYMICGRSLGDDAYDTAVYEVMLANEKLKVEIGESATQFEFETAVAFVCFKNAACDVAILECGMGGRDDATNIVKNKICCVFASISFDHMQYLGNTLTEIADVKSGIITCSCPVIAWDSSDETTAVIKKRCEEMKSPLYVVKDGDTTPHTLLCGSFQKQNAALAYRSVCVIRDHNLVRGCKISDEAIKSGFENVRWPFRFEKICDDPKVYVDGAHNADAAKKLASSIKENLAGYEIILVMAVFSDKEYDKVAASLAPLAACVITTQTPGNPRALAAQDLAECVKKYCKSVSSYESVYDACSRAISVAAEGSDGAGEKNRAVVACGSLSYLKLFSDAVKDMVHGQD